MGPRIFSKNLVSPEPFSVASFLSPFSIINPAYIRKNYSKEIIPVWNTRKSAIRPQNKAFKICRKWMLAYKENWWWGSNLDKCLSSYWKIIYQKLKCSLQLENGGPSIKLPLMSWFVIMAFIPLTLIILLILIRILYYNKNDGILS